MINDCYLIMIANITNHDMITIANFSDCSIHGQAGSFMIIGDPIPIPIPITKNDLIVIIDQ